MSEEGLTAMIAPAEGRDRYLGMCSRLLQHIARAEVKSHRDEPSSLDALARVLASWGYPANVGASRATVIDLSTPPGRFETLEIIVARLQTAKLLLLAAPPAVPALAPAPRADRGQGVSVGRRAAMDRLRACSGVSARSAEQHHVDVVFSVIHLLQHDRDRVRVFDSF